MKRKISLKEKIRRANQNKEGIELLDENGNAITVTKVKGGYLLNNEPSSSTG